MNQSKTPSYFRGRPSVTARRTRHQRQSIARAHDPYEHLAVLLADELGVAVPADVIASWERRERIRVWQLVSRVQMAGALECPVWPDCLAVGMVHDS